MEPQTSPVDPPETVQQLSNKYTYSESNTLLQNVIEFTRSLNVLKNHIEHLKNLTKEQASSKHWLKQCSSRMTASNFHRIYSRMNTLTKKADENPSNLLRSLLYSNHLKKKKQNMGNLWNHMLFKNLLAKTKDCTKISMCQNVDWFLWKKIHL